MRQFIKELGDIFLNFTRKTTSLRFVFTMYVIMLLTFVLQKGWITGSEYVKALLVLAGLFLGARTITHFERKNEKRGSNPNTGES